MKPSQMTVKAARDFDYPVEAVFAHWISPETRVRWEAGPGTGMVYDGFDTRVGGVETVRVIIEGQEIGHMTQTIHALRENEAMVVTNVGTFGGEVTMVMQLSLTFRPLPEGARIEASAQIMDLNGADVKSQHESGWEFIFDRFAEDLETYGPVGMNEG